MGWFDFDFLEDETIITVGGGVSRLRADSSIRDTMGLAINAAVIGGQDLGEAVRLHAATSTVSSYKKFEKACRLSSVGVSSTSFFYSGISKEQVASAIRTSTGQAYPVTTEIADGDISSGTLTSADHVLYALQENKAYNLSSNMFTHLGIDYVFDSYTDQFSGPDHIGYTIDGHIGIDTISFTLAVPKPTGNYWVVFYTTAGREYIWISPTTLTVFTESELAANGTNTPELQFAPIVNIRSNQSNITGTAYTDANTALGYISLDVSSINSQITEPEVEDISISLFSNLISDHQDQLAYNYAFFDYMADLAINDETLYNDLNGGILANSPVFSYSRLTVEKLNVYRNDTAWAYITRTPMVGSLGTDYTQSFAFSGEVDFVFGNQMCNYTINKKTSDTTYERIYVHNFFMSYTVFASEGIVKAFSVDIGVDSATTNSQLVIPFSYEIALRLPGKYRETVFLRCTQIALFSKQTTTLEWYQQEWFRNVITVITVIALVYAAFQVPQLIAQFEASAATLIEVAELAGIIITPTVALIYVIAEYAIVQYALKAVLVKILTSTDNQLLQVFATIGYAYLAMKITPGSISSTKQTLLGSLEAGFTGVTTVVENNNKKLGIEIQSLQQVSLGEKEQIEKANTINAQFAAEDKNYRKAQEALGIRNLFCNLGVPYINSADVQGYEVNSNISTMSGLIAGSCRTELLTPFILMQQTDNLLFA